MYIRPRLIGRWAAALMGVRTPGVLIGGPCPPFVIQSSAPLRCYCVKKTALLFAKNLNRLLQHNRRKVDVAAGVDAAVHESGNGANRRNVGCGTDN